MLGKAMLTMKRSSEDRNTPVRTIRAVSTGAGALAGERRARPVSSVMKRTLQKKVS